MRAHAPFTLGLGIAIGIALTAGATVVYAWTGPTGTAPNNNVAAPLNTSATAQTKSGNLTISGVLNLGNGVFNTAAGGTVLDANGNWVRTYGTGGWYNQTYGGGWYMQDTSWIRSYGSKNVYISAGFDTGGPSAVGCSGGLAGGYNFKVCGTTYFSGTLTQRGPTNSWAQLINWPPPGDSSYGILVGSGAGYSQFQNSAGYYSMLANSSWGLYTNGNIYAANIQLGSTGQWLSNFRLSQQLGGAYQLSSAWGYTGCPGLMTGVTVSTTIYGGDQGYPEHTAVTTTTYTCRDILY